MARTLHTDQRLNAPAPLTALRKRARSELARLPHELRTLKKGSDYHVQGSQVLYDLAKTVDEQRVWRQDV